MIESVAATDETDGESFLLLSGFEGLGANCNSGRYSCGLLIVHDGLILGVIEYCTFCTGSRRQLSTAYAHPKPETLFLTSRVSLPAWVCSPVCRTPSGCSRRNRSPSARTRSKKRTRWSLQAGQSVAARIPVESMLASRAPTNSAGGPLCHAGLPTARHQLSPCHAACG